MAMTALQATADRPMGVAAYADLALADLLERFARPDVDELLRESIQVAAAHDGDHLLLRAYDPEPLTDRSRSEEQTSELQSLMRTSYPVFILKNNNSKR